MTHSTTLFPSLRWPALLLTLASLGCVDYGIPGEKFTCRSQADCGGDMVCQRGEGTYCVCAAPGTPVDQGVEDPTCLNPDNLVACCQGGTCATLEKGACGIAGGTLVAKTNGVIGCDTTVVCQ